MTPAQSNVAFRIAPFLLQATQQSKPHTTLSDICFNFLSLTFLDVEICEMRLVLIITPPYTLLDSLVSQSYGNSVAVGSDITPAAGPSQTVFCTTYSITTEGLIIAVTATLGHFYPLFIYSYACQAAYLIPR